MKAQLRQQAGVSPDTAQVEMRCVLERTNAVTAPNGSAEPLRGGMDAVDRTLVDALRANGRATYAELARLVGLSAPSVQDRVKRLEDRGVIAGYTAVVPPGSIGLGVTALVGLGQSESAEQEDVVRRLLDVTEIEDCWLVAGEDAFVVKVRVADVAALEQTLARLQRIRGVSRTRTTVVLSTRWEGRAVSVPAAPD